MEPKTVQRHRRLTILSPRPSPQGGLFCQGNRTSFLSSGRARCASHSHVASNLLQRAMQSCITPHSQPQIMDLGIAPAACSPPSHRPWAMYRVTNQRQHRLPLPSYPSMSNTHVTKRRSLQSSIPVTRNIVFGQHKIPSSNRPTSLPPPSTPNLTTGLHQQQRL